MKRISLILSFVLLVFSFSALAQSERSIPAIRKEVAAINTKIKRQKVKAIDVSGIALEGAQASYYTSGRGLHKISAKLYGETYQSTVDIYYQGEQMIFAFEKFSRYKSQVGIPGGTKIVRTEERRFYFVNEQLVEFLIGKVSIKPSNERYAEGETGIVETARKLKEAYLESIR